MTEEEFDRRTELIMTVYGWILHSIELEPPGSGWSYTVGLRENFDHPDILMVERDLELQNVAVRAIVDTIVADCGCTAEVIASLGVRLVPVVPDQLDPELVLDWIDRYGRMPGPGDFVECRSAR